MKKIVGKSLLAGLLVAMSVFVVACGGGGEANTVTLTQNADDYVMEIKVPENPDSPGTSTYRFSTDEADFLKGNYSDFALVGDKFKMDVKNTNHVFHTHIDYEAIHGEIEYPTFEQYKTHVFDEEQSFATYDDKKEIKIGDREGVQYSLNDYQIRIVLNTDDIDNVPIFLTFRTDEANAKTVIEEADVKAVIDSIVLKKAE